jgi:hypothetical protein
MLRVSSVPRVDYGRACIAQAPCAPRSQPRSLAVASIFQGATQLRRATVCTRAQVVMTADTGADTGIIAADSDPRVKSVLAAIRGIPDFPKKVLTLPSNSRDECTTLACSRTIVFC